MRNENQLPDNDTDNDRKPNPCQRRRSSSVGSRRSHKGINIRRDSNRSENLIKCASSGLLFDSDATNKESAIDTPRSGNKFPQDIGDFENFFVNWIKDPKSVKVELTRLNENNIFKTGVPQVEKYNTKEYYPPVMFLISHPLKIDNDYEIYTINKYDVRISEVASYAFDNKKEINEEYHTGFKAITQKVVDIANTDVTQVNATNEISDEEIKNSRRHSEILGLIIANKNQPVSYFLPNKTSNGFEVVKKYGEVFVTDQARKSDKTLRHVVLSNDVLSIFASKKAERLKYKFFVKHLYCERCTDRQISNIDSSLRICGPFGDDLILTFSSPNIKADWCTAIQSCIASLLEPFKTHNTEVTIYKNLETNSSAPLMSKTFAANGLTTGLDLKKKAIEGFSPNDKNPEEFSLTFTPSNPSSMNREFVLHDNVIVMILQEHIGCFADATGCNEKCITNTNPPSRTHFYLKYSSLRGKKTKSNLDYKPTKSNKIVLSERWPDTVFPELIMCLLSDIYYEGSQTEGIFRISGSIIKSDALFQTICNGGDNTEVREHVYVEANALKKFFGSIDGSIFTYANKEKLTSLSNEIVSVDEFSKNIDQINRILSIVQTLPRINLNLLQLLFIVVNHIIKNEEFNKMSRVSLSVCLAPTLLPDAAVDLSPSNVHKQITLFECIFSLFDKLVDEGTQKKLIALLKERRVSTGLNCLNTEDMPATPTTNDSLLSSTGSDIVDETDGLSKSQPAVPPRRKRAEVEHPRAQELHPPAKEVFAKKVMLQGIRNSYSEEKPSDCVDGVIAHASSNAEIASTSGHEIVKVRYKPKKQNYRDRHTVAVSSADEPINEPIPESKSRTPDATQPSPFRRQFPVNRKHRDNSMTNYKTNFEDQKSTEMAQASPEESHQTQQANEKTPKLARNANRLIYDRESRARIREPNHNATSTSNQLVPSSKRLSLNTSKLEHRRSSSSSRVPTMVQEIENRNKRQNNGANNRPPTRTPENVINARIVRTPNNIPNLPNRTGLTRPMQPSRGALDIEKPRLPKRSGPISVQRSNTMEQSLKKTIETSDDKDVTII